VLGIDFQPPVTEIALQEQLLHNGMLIVCTAIFVIVFGFMFYSIVKHRKSVGHKAANFHESVGRRDRVDGGALHHRHRHGRGGHAHRRRDEGHDQPRPHDQGHRLPVEVGLQVHHGRGRGLEFLSTIDTAQRALADEGKPAGNDYLLKVDNPLVGAGRQEGARHHDRRRRDPRVDGARLRRQAGRDTRLRARSWFRATKTGDYYGQCVELCGKEHAFMPIHVVVMSAPDYTSWVDKQKKALAAKADDPKKVWDLAGLQARGEKVYNAELRGLPQAGRQGRGAGEAARRLPGRQRQGRDGAAARRAGRAPERRDAGMEGQAVRDRRSRRWSPIRRTHGATTPASSSSRPRSSPLNPSEARRPVRDRSTESGFSR
jgi:cytochrome c oxidase subunit 2